MGVLLTGPARRAGVACLLAATLATAACAARSTHPNGTTICDVHIPTGAMAVVAVPLQSPGPHPATGPAPATSQLPAAASAAPDYQGATYLRTSPSCDRGAVVVVQPPDRARLIVRIPAHDGGIAALGLEVTGQVTVQSWVGNTFEGSASLS